MTADLRLGLIGGNIAKSRAPLLHRLAGEQNGLVVSYERLVPKELGKSFDEVFDDCARGGYRGVNVTYPYKEEAARRVEIDDPLVRAIGAVNTVIFSADGPKGYNTDHSGFIEAYRSVRGDAPPGPTLMIGTGGVGRAVAFGLVALGATALRLVDRELAKAEALAAELRRAAPGVEVTAGAAAEAAAAEVRGVVNCTPVGMVGHEGTPLPRAAMRGAEWAFDAIYTPVETQFLRDAAAEGLVIVSGLELFFHQGFDAWALFSGKPLDTARLRRDLLAAAEAA
jgi:shikimate dehydrogenase